MKCPLPSSDIVASAICDEVTDTAPEYMAGVQSSPSPSTRSECQYEISSEGTPTPSPVKNSKSRLMEFLTKRFPEAKSSCQWSRKSSTISGFIAIVTVDIPIVGHVSVDGLASSTWKEAESSAAEKLLDELETTFRQIRKQHIRSEADVVVSCSDCSAELTTLASCCFYQKSEKEVEFGVREECTESMKREEKIVVSADHCCSERSRSVFETLLGVRCGKCQHEIGKTCFFGPDQVLTVRFGKGEVTLLYYADCARMSWRELKSLLQHEDIVKIPTITAGISSFGASTTYVPLQRSSKKEHFDTSDLIISQKTPRKYQVQAFTYALVSNLIVVIGTGMGKTLIASLVLHRMTKLNPQRIGVLIVDRIPLVYQQASAIELDTGMHVCRLSSENSTPCTWKKIQSKRDDVLVCTAGCLLELLRKQIVAAHDFSCVVFDECHHITGDHCYTTILREFFRRCPEKAAPTFLGLSASPVKSKDGVEALRNIRELKKSFMDSAVIGYTGMSSEENITWHTEPNTPQQDKANEMLLQALVECQEELSAITNKRMDAMVSVEHRPSWGAIIGWSRSLRYPHDGPRIDDFRQRQRDIEKYVYALECNELLGPYQVRRILDDSEDDDEDMSKLQREDLSAQLLVLEHLLQQLSDESRILIFVDTKRSARALQLRLRHSVPRFVSGIVLGNNGVDGMTWKQQEKLLKEFKNGSLQILISTSVLEEGLDVQTCNKVFKIGGRSSLIQLMQIRGRARAGNLVVILTESEKHRIDEYIEQERYLHSAIRAESVGCSVLRELPKELHEVLNSSNMDVESEDMTSIGLALHPGVQPRKDPDYVSVSFILDRTGCSNEQLTQALIYEMNSLDFEVKNIDIVPFSNSSRFGHLFDINQDCLVVVNIMTAVVDPTRYLQSTWQFTLKNKLDVLVPITAAMDEETIDSTEVSGLGNVDFALRHVRVVCVYGRRDISIGDTLGGNLYTYGTFAVTNKKRWKLSASTDDGQEVCVSQSLSRLSPFVLVEVDKRNDLVSVCVVMKSAPDVVLVDKNGSHNRVYLLSGDSANNGNAVWTQAQQDLHHLTTMPAFIMEFPYAMTDSVLNYFGNYTNLGAHGFITRFRRVERPISLKINTLKLPVLANDSVPSMSLVNIVNRCKWACQVLKDIVYSVALNERVVRDIEVDVYKILSGLLMTCVGTDLECRIVTLTEALETLPKFLSTLSPWVDAYTMFLRYIDDDLCEYRTKGSSQDQEATSPDDTDKEPDSVPVCAPSPLEKPGSELMTLMTDCNYVLLPRVLVTPSRVICRSYVMVKSNRMIRKYADRVDFIYVHFRDEDGQALFSEDVFCDRYRLMLRDGFQVCQRHITFLTGSGSQIRGQSATYIVGNKALVERIWAEQMPAYQTVLAENPSKFISRMGLFCTGDNPTVEVDEAKCKIEDDIRTCGDIPKLLTDGAGIVSVRMLEFLKKEYPLAFSSAKNIHQIQTCCAIQIRQAGRKGVFSISSHREDASDLLLPDTDFLVRNSMQKFATDESTLCIVSPACYGSLKLNRQFLNLLFSLCDAGEKTEWDPYARVHTLQENELATLAESLRSIEEAILALQPYWEVEILEALGESLLKEPFFVEILRQMYMQRCKMLRKKSQISVSELHGAYLMGIPDPTGQLRDGEIFVQVSPNSGAKRVISGRALLWRNPCCDPGDLIVVKCVDNAVLKEWAINVVVFPSNASCLRSLSSETSGGDLDGDKFSILWDLELIPPDVVTYDAVNYDEIARKAKQRHEQGENASNDMYTIIAATMCNPILGRLSNKHLAYCDKVELGACDPIARQAAEEVSIAVDYPKTGIPPRPPQEVNSLEEYPTFMESNVLHTYVSRKPIGLLYDRCTSVAYELNSTAMFLYSAEPDEAYIADGMETYIADAEMHYDVYRSDIEGLLTRFGLESEAELICAQPYEVGTDVYSDGGALKETLEVAWTCIKDRYTKVFYCDNYDNDASKLRAKASAWYVVAYRYCAEKRAQQTKSEKEQRLILSFPWIVGEHLVPQGAWAGGDECVVDEMVGRTVIDHYVSLLPQLRHVHEFKLKYYEVVKKAVESEYDVNVALFGSVSQLLCDESSDIDVYVEKRTFTSAHIEVACADTVVGDHTNPSGDEVVLLYSIVGALTLLPTSAINVLVDTAVPILRLKMDSETTGEASVEMDICARKDGFYKAAMIDAFYRSNAGNVVVLSCLQTWAKCCGVLPADKSCPKSDYMRNGEFHAIVMSILYDNSAPDNDDAICPTLSNIEVQIDLSSSSRENELDRLHDIINPVLQADSSCASFVGAQIAKFFRNGSKMSSAFEYVWPVPGAPTHNIKASLMSIFSDACAHAYHVLSATRSFEALLLDSSMTAMDSTCVIVLPSRVVVAEELLIVSDFHAARLHEISGARVYISASRTQCAVHGKGSPNQIRLLKGAVYKLFRMGNYFLTGLARQHRSAYFMDGCSCIFSRQAASSEATVKFEDYLSNLHQPQHSLNSLSRPYLTGRKDHTSDEWAEAFKHELRSKVFDQLKSLKLNDKEELTVSIHFGTFYCMNSADIFPAESDTGVSLNTIQNAYAKSRKQHRREEWGGEASPPLLQTTNRTCKEDACDADTVTVTKKKPKNFSSSYWNSIVSHDIPEHEWDDVYRSVASALTDIGFMDRGCDTTRTCLVECVASRTYSAHVSINVDDDVVNHVCERPLHWVQATLLSGKRLNGCTDEMGEEKGTNEEGRVREAAGGNSRSTLLRNHDLRLKVITNSPLTESSELYRRCTWKGLPPVQIQSEDQGVSFREGYAYKDQVEFARYVNKKVTFEYKLKTEEFDKVEGSNTEVEEPESNAFATAYLSSGYHYTGRAALDERQVFFNLAVKFDVSPLLQWVMGNSGTDEPSVEFPYAWLNSVVDLSLLISERISQPPQIGV